MKNFLLPIILFALLVIAPLGHAADGTLLVIKKTYSDGQTTEGRLQMNSADACKSAKESN